MVYTIAQAIDFPFLTTFWLQSSPRDSGGQTTEVAIPSSSGSSPRNWTLYPRQQKSKICFTEHLNPCQLGVQFFLFCIVYNCWIYPPLYSFFFFFFLSSGREGRKFVSVSWFDNKLCCVIYPLTFFLFYFFFFLWSRDVRVYLNLWHRN
jgi:hypothetical protein